MTPNFALSLSFEGIRLLVRQSDEWREVGDVALTSADLAGELEKLETENDRLNKQLKRQLRYSRSLRNKRRVRTTTALAVVVVAAMTTKLSVWAIIYPALSR